MSHLFDPFSSIPNDCITSFSETRLIESIRDWLGPVSPESPRGIGDDCAVTDISAEETFLLTTIDGVAWNEHFDASVSPELAGRKLMGRNLSDIASMGGTPRRAVVSLWMGKNTKIEWLRSFYGGVAALAKEYGVEIVGGDVSRAPESVFIADLCLQGMSDRPIQRKQVSEGDTIWVTGSLGGSILGRHATFIPRVLEGKWLKASGWAKSMMDISDGLAKDLPSLIGLHEVRLKQLPISQDARRCAKATRKDPWEHALCDGEDYELVFVMDAGQSGEDLIAQWQHEFGDVPLMCIGAVGETSDLFTLVLQFNDGDPQVFDKGGYEHF